MSERHGEFELDPGPRHRHGAAVTAGTLKAATGADATTKGRYHFLDVGEQKYGDCIVVEFGQTRVLIDGSHEKDFFGQDGFESTPEQLQIIFEGEATPHPITLMVVTHCHQDHIGALPMLVAQDVIKPKWALITDQKLGFGRSDDDSDVTTRADLATERTQRLAAALREEDASDLSDTELEEFMDGAATVESKYAQMIKTLRKKGVKIVQYRGPDSIPAALLADMKSAGMMVLGPSEDQLAYAAAQIAKTNKDASDAVMDALAADSSVRDVRLYRRIVARENAAAAAAMGMDADDEDFRNPRGNGMNCQSITLAFGPPNARALLAGDMQFTEPGVAGADAEVAALRDAVVAAGPFRLFKTTHHTSHNGQDGDLLNDLGSPPIIVHTGGSRDASHPFPKVLKTLKSRSRDIIFARTDRNGLITVEPHRSPDEAVTISRGRVNDFTENVVDTATELVPVQGELLPSISRRIPDGRTAPQVVIVNLPEGNVDMRVAGVEISVRTPRVQSSRPTNIQNRGRASGASPDPAPPRRSAPADLKLANGRVLPRLLFVTDSAKLQANLKPYDIQSVLQVVKLAKNTILLDVAGRSGRLRDDVRAKLRADPSIAGVVILGGYDVVPSIVVDVLPPALRQELGAGLVTNDADRFYVWSDEPYGDIDGDHIAEFPVSRVPDAHDPQLFFNALQADGIRPLDRFGVRNVARPFAIDVWNDVVGRGELHVSKDFVSNRVPADHTTLGSQYFMLHGNDTDATVFSGENPPGYTRAFSIDKVPTKFDGVVFSGCCWGALIVEQKASEAGNDQPAPRASDQSIALSYLRAGANAFIGCTGAHYSGPNADPDVNYALRMHSAFWKTLPHVQHSASLALFGARKYYGELIGSGQLEREPLDIARRLKNRAQFTCLGLGW